MEQLRVAPDRDSVPRRLSDLVPRDARLIVLAIRRSEGKMIFNPPVDIAVSGGDFLIVMGEQPSLRDMESILTRSDQ